MTTFGKEVDEEWNHNKRKLLEANEENPVANITAVEKGFHAKSMTSDKAGGLLPVVYIRCSKSSPCEKDKLGHWKFCNHFACCGDRLYCLKSVRICLKVFSSFPCRTTAFNYLQF
jgi:hypothetical protein